MSVFWVVASVFALSVVADNIMYYVDLAWKNNRYFLYIGSVLAAFGSSTLSIYRPNIFTFVFTLLSFYRIFCNLRVAKDNVHEKYLRHSGRRSSAVLTVIQLFTILTWVVWIKWDTSGNHIWLTIGLINLTTSILMLTSTIRRMRKTTWPSSLDRINDEQLPSVTVAIPARNETEDLEECLRSIIANSYQKLEVLVLDDCSQNRRTSEIIGSFAHDGVRFIKGSDPRDSWLPKNQAYSRLAEEASGEYILFCGVDVRFQPDSISQIMSFMLERNKTMVSILPLRLSTVYGRFALIQSMRYLWELVPPRRFFNRPPVVSSCWAIKQKSLTSSGGFAAVSRSVLPEAYFAKKLVHDDSYSFMRSDKKLGVESSKSTLEQRDTAIRMRYPQLHRRPENVFLASGIEVFLLVTPFAMLISGSIFNIGLTSLILSAITSLILVAVYEIVAISTHVNKWWFALVSLPAVILTDIWLIHYSMWKYEFSTVSWKGRNICIPTMHIVPKLPKLSINESKPT